MPHDSATSPLLADLCPPEADSSQKAALASTLRDLTRHDPGGLAKWARQVSRLGGCTQPVRLTGDVTHVDTATGELRQAFTTAHEPHGQLMTRCNNRRASRCPSCAEVYRRDTFQLIRAGLVGGKGVPDDVTGHPRVFATLTAESFGPVHHRVTDAHGRVRPCQPHTSGPSCGRRHADDDPLLGTPVDPDTYDYAGAVLWNAHTGDLWHRFAVYLRRALARAGGLTRSEFARTVRLSYGKVAEFQRRGLVHVHAIIRLDGRDPDDPDAFVAPPSWCTTDVLTAAIREAAAAVRIETPDLPGSGSRTLRWGRQLDVRPVAGFAEGAVTEKAVAAYLAKYATKAAETTGTLDRPLTYRQALWLDRLDVPEHARRMIRTTWDLGAHPALAHLKLRKWAHMLGFRGHFSTKSRRYSTTLGALRQARADYAATATDTGHHDGAAPLDGAQHDHGHPPSGPPEPSDPDGGHHDDGAPRDGGRPDEAARPDHGAGADDEETVLVLAHWRFAGQGYTPGESLLAAALTPTRDTEGGPPCPSSC